MELSNLRIATFNVANLSATPLSPAKSTGDGSSKPQADRADFGGSYELPLALIPKHCPSSQAPESGKELPAGPALKHLDFVPQSDLAATPSDHVGVLIRWEFAPQITGQKPAPCESLNAYYDSTKGTMNYCGGHLEEYWLTRG